MRVKRGFKRARRRNRVLKLAKGYFGSKHALYNTARQQVERALAHAYIGRRLKKRDFRKLWIIRIAAAARQNDLSYSKFTHGLKLAGIELNRKQLSEIAIHDPATFANIVNQARKALEYGVRVLNEKDRFNIISFSGATRPFRDGLMDASYPLERIGDAFADLEAGSVTRGVIRF